MADAQNAKPARKDDQKRNEHGQLNIRSVFGLKADVKSNVHYVDETQLLYPAGHNTVLYSTDHKSQRLFPGTPDAEDIACLALSPNKRYLAVGERAERALCTIFDVPTGKRRKVLNFEFEARTYVSMSFSHETKFLITQSGAPEWQLIYWAWDKARPLAALKIPQGNIRECSISPQDSSLCCVIGDGVFKFLRLQDGVLKGLPNQLAKLRESQNQNYTCHSWLHDDRLVLCTESGDILLFDQGSEFKMVLPCSPNSANPGTSAHRSLLTIAAFSKGFVCGGDNGHIKVFERSDDPKEVFRKAKDMRVDQPDAVRSLAITPSDEFIAVTVSNQLYQLSLSSDLLKTEDGPSFDYLLTSFHTGPIFSVDICTRKPLIVTCGADKTIRVWNYLDKTCELCKAFNEEAYSVAFHPSGFHLIAGFSDKLRLLNLLMEDMRTFKEIPIKACKEVRFANGGHYFAAVNNNAIQVYRTYTCEIVCNLRGHNAKVRSLSWAADDSSLVSCGMDGSVYEFSVIKEGQRLQDWMHKGTSFNTVCTYPRENVAPAGGGKEKKEEEKLLMQGSKNALLVAGNDKMIKEIHNSQLANYIECDVTVGQLCLTNQAPRSVLAGVAEHDTPGAIRWYNFPLDGEYTEYQTHAQSVVRISVTYDDTLAASVGEDGTLFIWDVVKKTEGRKRDAKEALPFADEILVTRTFLDDKRAALFDLERQVEELSNQIEFQLRHRDAFHKDKMAELEDKYGQEIEQERTKYELLREEKNEMEMEYEDNTKNLEENHSKQVQDLESSFQHKMTIEVQRYQKLMQDLDRERKSWHAQHNKLIQQHDRVVEDTKLKFDEKQKVNRTERQRILEEKEGAFKEHHETLRQLEEDADREIEELKELYEAKLAQEKDEKVRLRGQAGIHRKHHEDLKRQMNKKEEELKGWIDQNKKKQERLYALVKEKESNLKEIKERDKTIADKEHRIYELKKQNQELEKFKFVLDYKIKELKAQIDPKNDDIAEMRQQIQAMDAELEDYMRKNKQLALDISQLQLKHKALQDEKKSQKKKLKENMRFIKTFKLDMDETVVALNDPKKLKESVAKLYRKLMQGTAVTKETNVDVDKSKEYNRQRDYLEKSVDSLKRKLEKDSQVHRTDNMRIMGENVALIREINDLRRELNFLKQDRNAESQPIKSAITPQLLERQREEISKLSARSDELDLMTARVPEPGTQLAPIT